MTGFHHPRRAATAALLVLATIAASCVTTASVAAASSSHTITIGVLTDLTGLASSTEKSVPLGIKAGVGVAKTEGYDIKYVIADAGTSTSGVLTAAQTLVEQDHVFAVIAISAVTFAAASYLTSHNVPVVGASIDGTEWTKEKNMFSIDGTEDYTKVYTQAGDFFKAQGVTNVAGVAYGITPSSAQATEGVAASAKAAGLKVGYLTANFPFGSTNVAPVALAIKGAGSNGLFAGTETSTSFSLVTALRNDGAKMKVILLPIGYGSDLTSAGKAAEQTAQGVYFEDLVEPVEMHTAATEKFQQALKTYAGVTSDPDLNESLAYLSVGGLVTGLKAAGGNPTQQQFIDAMLKISKYNGTGLYGSHSVGFTMAQRGEVFGTQACAWIVKFTGTTFHLVSGAEPSCGKIIPGAHV